MIYFNRLENGVIYLLVIYAKTVRGNIPAHLLNVLRRMTVRGQPMSQCRGKLGINQELGHATARNIG